MEGNFPPTLGGQVPSYPCMKISLYPGQGSWREISLHPPPHSHHRQSVTVETTQADAARKYPKPMQHKETVSELLTSGPGVLTATRMSVKLGSAQSSTYCSTEGRHPHSVRATFRYLTQHSLIGR